LTERHPWLFTLAFAVLYAMAAEVGHLLSFRGEFATVWPPSGLYLSAFLLIPRRGWRWVMLGAGVGNLFSDIVLHGQSLPTSLTFWLINTTEAWIASHLMLRLGMHTVNFDSLGNVTRLALVASTVAMLHSAVWGATASVYLLGAHDWITAWVLWWSSCLIGVLLVVPLLAALFNHPLQRWQKLTPRLRLEAGAVLVLVALTSWVSLNNPQRPLDFLPFPALLWASMRFGSTGAAMSVSVAILVSVARVHELASAVPETVQSDAVELQLYACTMSLSFLALGALMASHQRVHEESLAMEERFRDLLDHIGDLVFLIRLDSHVEYANPSGLQLLVTDDTTPPASMELRTRLLAEDQPTFDRAMREIVAGKPQVQARLRATDHTQQPRIFLARLTPRRRGEHLEQVRIVLHDVTAREERDQLLELRRQQPESGHAQPRELSPTEPLAE
jgi:integral membrane sensor domain MASE1